MNDFTISTGAQNIPLKVVLYGPEGIGKSTFASKFPRPLFIDTEGSTKHMNVMRFDGVDRWNKLIDAVLQAKSIAAEMDIRTLVIDTADWAEMFCIQAICESRKVASIEDIGYGKGYTFVQESFKKLLDELDTVIDAGLNVVITAHAKMRKFEQPDEMGAYDRWEMKLTRQVAPMLKEWSDMLLFANYKTIVVTDSKTNSKHAQGGKRVMYTTHHACWDAKNRFGLEECLDFDYESIRLLIRNGEDRVPAKKEEPKPKKETKKEPEVKPVIDGAPEQVSMAYAELKEKMNEAHITDEEVQLACANKGLQDGKLPVWDYPEEFINNMLIRQFAGFSKYIAKEIKDVPFIKHWDNLN